MTERTAQAPLPETPEAAHADPERLAPLVEAILLTCDRPAPPRRLAEALGLAAPEPDAGTEEPRPKGRSKRGGGGPDVDGLAAIDAAVKRLNEQYAQSGRSFRIEAVAGGLRLMTLPAFAQTLAAYHQARASSRLSKAAIEALAIIAYKQPITRAHLEAIRGVNCGEILRTLLDRRLITVAGRAEELGRPLLYGTTKEFLDAFGLASLKDLPSAAELRPA